MRRWSVLAPVAALGVFLAACGEETSDPAAGFEAEGTETAVDAGADEDGAGPPSDRHLAVADSDLGQILVDGDGMTLYLFTEDPPGESVCFDDCLAAWPPLLVDGEPSVGEGVDEQLVGTIERDDGSTQVTYDGAPLYLWSSDGQPGDVTGQDVQGVWYVVSPDGGAIMADEMDESDESDDSESGPGPSY